jgi:hypothetical protein
MPYVRSDFISFKKARPVSTAWGDRATPEQKSRFLPRINNSLYDRFAGRFFHFYLWHIFISIRDGHTQNCLIVNQLNFAGVPFDLSFNFRVDAIYIDLYGRERGRARDGRVYAA